jgi:hypothetical protein
MWIHKGICAFTQQGCKYKHEMPLDKATQTSLGLFHGLPEWYKRAQAVELAPTGALARSRGRGYSAPQGQKYIENGRPDIAIGRGDGGMGDMGPGLANRRLEQLLQPFPAPAGKSICCVLFAFDLFYCPLPSIPFSSLQILH